MRQTKLAFTGERMIPEFNKGAAFYFEHLARYLFASQFTDKKNVMDAGCGVGYGAKILVNEGKAKNVVAIDISDKAINYAQKKYSHDNIQYVVDDLINLTKIESKTINVVVCFEVIEHLKQQDQLLSNFKRVMQPNGILVISTPNKENYQSGNPFHLKELHLKQFEVLLEKHFKYVSVHTQIFELSNIIKKNGNDNSFNQQTISPQTKTDKAEYFIAVCSDIEIDKINGLSVNSNKVDFFDLSGGLESLRKQHDSLSKLHNEKDAEIRQLTEEKIYLQGGLAALQKQFDATIKILEEKKITDSKAAQLEEENVRLEKELLLRVEEHHRLDQTIQQIRSTKLYGLWQGYRKIKNIIF